jgi:hypothetical protein
MPALNNRSDDRLTIIAFAIIAGFLAAIMHEGLGHALVAYLQGAKELTLTNCYLNSDINTRAIDAAGTIVNLIVGAGAWFCLRRTKSTNFSVRYYLWLTMTLNLFDGTGYFFYSGVAGIGDWQDFIKALHPYWVWRVGLILLGASLYFGVIMLSTQWLTRLLEGTANATTRLWGLTMLPYFTIGLAGSIAALPNLLGWKLIVISAAAATFGGLAGFFSIRPGVEGRLRGLSAAEGAPAFIPRNRLVIALAILVFLVNIGIFGRGLTWQNQKVFLARAANLSQ